MRSFTSSAAGCTLALLMVVMLAQQAEAGIRFLLGGADGWTNKANIDYNQWMSDYKFKLGDILVFHNADSTDHTVVMVDKQEYDSCGDSGEKGSPTTVSPGIVLEKTPLQSGDYYFICDVPGHCVQGQKVYIQVLNTDGSVNTTTTPSQGPPGASTAPQMPGFTWTSQLVIVVVSAFSLMAAAASM